MRNLSGASAILGILIGASSVLALSAVGCGGDDSTGGTDGGGDTSADHTSEATADHIVSDATKPDASDASADSPTDSPTDVIGTKDADAGPPADAAALLAFADAASNATCQRLATCCDGTDAGGFQLAECVQDYNLSGGVNGLGIVTGGNIVLNETQATQCLSLLSTFPCGTYDTAQNTAQAVACVGAFAGRSPIGGPCTTFWDCANPGYCQAGVDGGPATCQEIHPVDTACVDTVFSSDCTYQGNGDPANYCDPTTLKCTADLPNGTPCEEFNWCQSQICDSVSGACQATSIFSDPGTPGGTCAFFNTPVDGG
jgi:hypothetical protein